MTEDQLKALDGLYSGIEKDYGQGITIQEGKAITIPRIPLQSISLKYLFGGGFPLGRVGEFFGPESTGKTTIWQLICADLQSAGYNIAWIDAEHAFDKEYAQKLGMKVDKEHFSLFVPDYGEQALDLAERCIDTKLFRLIVVDSVAALTPLAELEGDMTDQQMGAQARMIGKGLRKIVAKGSKALSTLGLINQIRMKIGVMFGNPETTPGGNSVKFFSSFRWDIRIVERLMDSEENHYGNRIRITSKKSKVSPPNRKVEFDLIFGKGIDIIKDYIEFAVKFGVIQKSGTWYSYKEERLGQGIANATEMFRNNNELFQKIQKQVDDIVLPNCNYEDELSSILTDAAEIIKEKKSRKGKKKEDIEEKGDKDENKDSNED